MLLGGLALKRRWQERRRKAGQDVSKPNIVMGTETHVVGAAAVVGFWGGGAGEVLPALGSGLGGWFVALRCCFQSSRSKVCSLWVLASEVRLGTDARCCL